MPKAKKSSSPLAEVRASVKRITGDGERLFKRLQRDAQALVKHTRAEAARDVQSVRKDLERRANRTVRDMERKLLKQMHAATESQVRRLERRLSKLERIVADLGRKAA